MKRIFKLLYFVTYLASLHVVKAVSHLGKWKDVKFEKDHLFFVKSMYKNTDITVDVSCEKDEETGPFVIEWMLRYSPCAQEYQVLENGAEASLMLKYYLDDTKKQYLPFNYSEVEFMRGSTTNKCKSHGNQKMYLVNDVLPSFKQEKINGVQQKSSGSEGQKDTAIDTADEDKQDESAIDTADKEKKDESDVTEKKTDNAKRNKRLATTNNTIENITVSTALAPQHDAKIGTAWRSGYYVLILRVNASKNLKVNVEMKGRTGYISAVEWPLLIFYGVMGLVYIIYGLVWIVLLACNWRELMRLQFWIGGVIVLGMLEKAVFYSEYQSIANTGLSVAEGTLIIAEVISCFKRALARMLIIIVSVGFGVVRPRLGPTFHKVLFVGGLYFILAVVEGCMRTLKPKGDQSTDTALAALPLALLDAAICWWISF
ncbi:hypothetical protein DPMN_097414 [Dreissena polymorpha]|uniref:Transmembrane protein 87A n=1 Tax=Dreissena polymorpha TaxID=45954 RepID=A0A9D4LB32_DREPO|nr:hypothetical protein DPMN_097414 [Dreissena polymorpha]